MNRETKKMIWLASAVVLLSLGSATKEYAKSQTDNQQNYTEIENQKNIVIDINKIMEFRCGKFDRNAQIANTILVNIPDSIIKAEKSIEVQESFETIEIVETNEVIEEIEEIIEPEEIYSAAELEILYRITEAEASGEGEFGKTLVANVILNRVHSNKFPDSIEGVVFQRKHGVQFSPTVNGRYYSIVVTDETREAVHKALKEDYTNGALYFRMTKGSKGNWHDRNLQKVFSHGTHTFYK